MITGFRWHLQGAQRFFELDPDLSTFGKGMANGFAMAALVGKREIMDLGGITHDRARVFLVSTTHGAENHALAATRACLRIYREEGVIAHLWKIGTTLLDGLNAVAAEAGLAGHFTAIGYPCNPNYVCRDRAGEVSLLLRTLFLQEMIRRGVIVNYLVPSFAHQAIHVEQTLDAARASLAVYARALEEGWERYLEGPPIKPVFRAFN